MLFAIGGAFADVNVDDAFLMKLVIVAESLYLAHDMSGGGTNCGIFVKRKLARLVAGFRWIKGGFDTGGLELGW